MFLPPGKRFDASTLTRREFLWMTGIAGAATAVGCAVNPVTGENQFMLVSEAYEKQVDQESSPHQFSADYGAAQDAALNRYLSDVGNRLAAASHRPEMPYSFRAVNATYVNAYAFPGGSIAATRGILLGLDNEAELAALMGHEIGHVSARHTATRMTKQLVVGVAVAVGTAVVAEKNKKYAPLAAGLGAVGAGALLARYSRKDERQADQLGMEYMVKGGYTPAGMVGLMELLMSMSDHKPNIIELMFATHPMSSERLETAKNRLAQQYAAQTGLPDYRDRYMDNTADLRAIRGAVEAMQNGESAMMQEKFTAAEGDLRDALAIAPRDYAGLTMMAKLKLVQEQYPEAERYAQQAIDVYPQEAQAHHVAGIAKLSRKDYDAAYAAFDDYEKLLPGNPNTIFLKGLSQEGMEHKQLAADEYTRFLKIVNQGEQAEYARGRLIEWGYMQSQTAQGS